MNKAFEQLKKSRFLPLLCVFLIALFIGIKFRLFPLLSHTSNDSADKAAIYVLWQLKQKVKQDIHIQHPNATEQQKQILAKQRFNQILKTDGAKIRKTMDELALTIKDGSQQKQNTPYLLASDSFYYYHLTEKIIQDGSISDTKKGSKYLNELMLAPVGHWEPFTLHPYVGFWTFKAFQLFDSNIDLMYALSFTPLILTGLALIVFVLLCSSLNFTYSTTLTGAVFFLLSPIFIKRSTFGWYDNDPYNVLFPLLILLCFLISLKNEVSSRHKTLWSCLLVSSILLYALFWQGWMLMLVVIFLSSLWLFLVNGLILKQRDQRKPLGLLLGITSLGSFIGITLIYGMNEFFILFQEGFKALQNFMVPQLSPWPDLYMSVGELHLASFEEIINMTGSMLFLGIAVLGLIYALAIPFLPSPLNDQKKRLWHQFGLTLGIFFVIALLISLKAQRFIIFCLIPLSLTFPMGLEFILIIFRAYLIPQVTKNSLWRKSFTGLVHAGVLALLVLPVLKMNTSIKSLLNPIYNDTWHNALTQIRKQTPEDSIVTTWWPPGHFIKATANRRVTFDGATINYPQAYWISNFFLNHREEEAVGILRMLNNSANEPVNYMQDRNISLSLSIKILKDIMRKDRATAETLLRRLKWSTSEINELLDMTHQKPPPSYVLIYNEFVKNNLQLSFIGRWNFEKIEAINDSPELMKKVPKRNSPEYIQFLWSLVGGPHKYSDVLNQVNRVKEVVLFDQNVTVNLKTKDCRVSSKKYGKGTPKSLFYVEDGQMKEKVFQQGNLSFSAFLIENDNRHSVILTDRLFAKSMLMQLYFFDGKGLKYFKPVIHETDLTKRTDIKVFKVDWERYLNDLHS